MKIFSRSLHSLRRVVLVSFLLGAAAVHADSTDITDLLKNNQPQQALKLLDQRLAAAPKDPQLRFLQGVALAMDNKNKEAIDAFTRLTEEYPELPEPYNNLAVLYANQNQLEKSRQALEQAIRTNPSYSTAHENLGDIYAKLASQAYSKALQLDDSHAGSVKPKLALIHDLFSNGQSTPKALAQTAQPPASAQQRPAQTAAVAPAAPVAPATPASEPAPVPTVAAPAAPAVAKAAAEATGTSATDSSKAETATAGKNAPAATEAVAAAVYAWAKAWESKNVAAYLAAYSPEFQTPGKQSRQRWEEERRIRIVGKTAISVQLAELSVQMPRPDQATVRFSQHYKANNLDTRSRKTLQLEQRGGQWLIVRETVGN